MKSVWLSWVFWIALGVNAADWLPLWDGKTLAGWQVIGAGQWLIEEGAVHGRHSRWSWTYGHLVSERSFTNFTVRFKFKALAGNSGFYFRAVRSGASGIAGFQAEIDPAEDCGGLYESGGRGWVVKPAVDELRANFKPGEWNEMMITARGRQIQVRINGWQAAELEDSGARSHGIFALQLHAWQTVDVWFKDLEIREAP